jgi:hypothetical protein
VAAHLVRHLVGQLGAPVVHGQQDRRHVQRRVQVGPHQFDVGQQLAQALQRVVLALDRDEHLVTGDQGVHREQSERGRAVHEHVVHRELVQHRGRQGLAQPALPGHHADQLDLGPGQIDRGRHTEQVRRRGAGHDRVGQSDLAEQRLVDRGRADPVLDAERGARVPLRVEIDHQHPHPVHGQRGGQVDGARGLAHAALLVGHRDHSPARRTRHLVPVGMQYPGRALRLLGDRRPARCFT